MATTPNHATYQLPPQKTEGTAQFYRGEPVDLRASELDPVARYTSEAVDAARETAPINTNDIDEPRMQLDGLGGSVIALAGRRNTSRPEVEASGGITAADMLHIGGLHNWMRSEELREAA